jgi:hypothetical protein
MAARQQGTHNNQQKTWTRWRRMGQDKQQGGDPRGEQIKQFWDDQVPMMIQNKKIK